jgi:hypothetical protein
MCCTWSQASNPWQHPAEHRQRSAPATLDTLVATNLHADILSDLAAALASSLGTAPTGNIDPERRYPSMFEPIHGSAFDTIGQGLANPVGTFWSVVMLLEHLYEFDAAQQLMRAIEQVTANPALHTGDLGGKATTAQATQAECEMVRAQGRQPPAVDLSQARLLRPRPKQDPQGDTMKLNSLPKRRSLLQALAAVALATTLACGGAQSRPGRPSQ